MLVDSHHDSHYVVSVACMALYCTTGDRNLSARWVAHLSDFSSLCCGSVILRWDLSSIVTRGGDGLESFGSQGQIRSMLKKA